eukprot:367912_1
MSIHCINKGETQLEWEFETCDYFAQLNDKCLVKEALETWRANNMFVLDEGGRISINSKHFNPAHLRKGKALIEYYTNKKIDIPHRVDAAIDDSREAFGRASLFTLLGLQRIQSIISVMKQEERELMIVISNES